MEVDGYFEKSCRFRGLPGKSPAPPLEKARLALQPRAGRPPPRAAKWDTTQRSLGDTNTTLPASLSPDTSSPVRDHACLPSDRSKAWIAVVGQHVDSQQQHEAYLQWLEPALVAPIAAHYYTAAAINGTCCFFCNCQYNQYF